MIRHFIREQIENKQLVNIISDKINTLLNRKFIFKQINEYQYNCNCSSVGNFIFLKNQEILLSIFRITENNYKATFQVYWTNKSNDQKKFVCNLKSMNIDNNKVTWNKNY